MSITRNFIWYLLTSNKPTMPINRQTFWKVLRYFGIPQKYLYLIKICNKKTNWNIKHQQELSEMFYMKSGQQPGNALTLIH